MNDSRGILVTGIGHSGTSATAGILHKAGIYMGRDKKNYEDRTWWTLVRRLYQYTNTGDKLSHDIMGTYPEYNPNYNHARMRDMLLRQMAQRLEVLRKRRIWGIKQPQFANVWVHIRHLFEDVRIVICERDPTAIMASLYHANHDYRKNGKAYFERHMANLIRMAEETAFPVYRIQYEALIADPKGQGSALIAWCFDGLKVKPKPDAWRHIDPEKLHFRGGDALHDGTPAPEAMMLESVMT